MCPLKLKMTASICTLKSLFHCKANIFCVLSRNKQKKRATHIAPKIMAPHIPFTCTLSSKTKRHTHVHPASAAPAVRCTPRSREEGVTQLPQGWRRKRKQTGKMETKRRRRKKKEERKKEQKVLGWSRCG